MAFNPLFAPAQFVFGFLWLFVMLNGSPAQSGSRAMALRLATFPALAAPAVAVAISRLDETSDPVAAAVLLPFVYAPAAGSVVLALVGMLATVLPPPWVAPKGR